MKSPRLFFASFALLAVAATSGCVVRPDGYSKARWKTLTTDEKKAVVSRQPWKEKQFSADPNSLVPGFSSERERLEKFEGNERTARNGY